MDVQSAVQKARAYLQELFQGEEIEDIGLEEVVFDEESNEWKVTIGFSRPWEKPNIDFALSEGPKRSYKVIRIDNNGTIKSLMDRTLTVQRN
ncbi:MAG: hypothetical protein OXG33_05040 [Chloroflexi bacterium]|nr:hypothetical protein [Chloroflexota bacterium]